MMDWKDTIEDWWNEIKDRSYYIIGVILLIAVPFVLTSPGLPRIPIISDLYANSIGNVRLFGSNNFFLSILSLCIIWAIFAASWDLLSGYTGQISFGHSIFFGLSAYVAFWTARGFIVDPLLSGILGPNFVLDPLIAMLLGGLVSALLAVCIGIIALRVKGPYLALITLVIPLITSSLFKLEFLYKLTGGDHGFPNMPLIIEPVNDITIDTTNFYFFALIVLFISVGIMMLIAYSRFGLLFQSIREDEDAAESLGINIHFYKILAFAISAFFAGIAGGMYSQYRSVVVPSFFDTNFSFSIIIMVVIGGISSINGGVIGAFLLTILVEIFLGDIFPTTLIEGMDILAFGALLVITLRYMPRGLSRATSDQKKAVVLGILFSLSWSIIPNSEMFTYLESLTINNLISFLFLLLLLILTLPAIPIFIISEFIGLFTLEGLLGFNLSVKGLLKAKFLIYAIAGIPYAYYLPKIFKYLRLRFWGVWPSAGRYEPD